MIQNANKVGELGYRKFRIELDIEGQTNEKMGKIVTTMSSEALKIVNEIDNILRDSYFQAFSQRAKH